MSPMAQMSKAIREVIEEHSSTGTLKGIDAEALQDFVRIVAAFHADLREELGRRSGHISDREALAIADQHDIQTRLK